MMRGPAVVLDSLARIQAAKQGELLQHSERITTLNRKLEAVRSFITFFASNLAIFS